MNELMVKCKDNIVYVKSIPVRCYISYIISGNTRNMQEK